MSFYSKIKLPTFYKKTRLFITNTKTFIYSQMLYIPCSPLLLRKKQNCNLKIPMHSVLIPKKPLHSKSHNSDRKHPFLYSPYDSLRVATDKAAPNTCSLDPHRSNVVNFSYIELHSCLTYRFCGGAK